MPPSPAWLAAPAPAGRESAFEVPVRSLGTAIPVWTWAPADARDDEPLPLLVAHDGPEYAERADLTRYLSAGVAGKWLPRLRAALVAPAFGHRDRWYSASARYTNALAHVVLPAVDARLAVSTRAGMGASLGALAMLHAHCRYPALFDGLFLQSGSFFTDRDDGRWLHAAYYRRILAFVAAVRDGGLPARKVPIVLTCGVIEENIGNNRLMTAAMQAQGYRATLHETPGGHDFPAWRDAFDPPLAGLLGRLSS